MSSPSPWHSLKGTARMAAEHKHMQKLVSTGGMPQVSDIEFVQDQITIWQFKLSNFDTDLPGGVQLNKDLQQLKTRYGLDHILMEIRFPADYPTKPFFLRVVKPRMVMYTGHVTAGGSICIESLTLSGRPSGWQSYYSVETILMEVIANMVDCPVVYVQTPTGPGGMSGPLRIDFSMGTREYSLAEAQQAFARTEANHRATGWGPLVPLSAPAAPLPAPLPAVPTSSSILGAIHRLAGYINGAQNPASKTTSQAAPHIAGINAGVVTNVITGIGTAGAGAAAAAQTVAPGKRSLKRSRNDGAASGFDQLQPNVADLTSPTPANRTARTLRAESRAKTTSAAANLTKTNSSLANNGLPLEGSSVVLDLTISDSDDDDHAGVNNGPAANTRRRVMLTRDLEEVHKEKEELARQKAELEKQKEALQKQVEQLEKERGLGFAPIPSHWTVTPITPTGIVEYIELPLPKTCGKPAGGSDSAAYNDQDMFDDDSIEELVANGATRAEAIEILQEADGDIDDAMVLLVERRCGTRRASKKKAPVISEAAKKAEADRLEQEREKGLAEAAEVLTRLEQHNGMKRKHVQRIERVQNLKLWTSYQRRLLEVQEAAWGNANEMDLWHGTGKTVITTITKEGFDVRVADLNGAQGAGSYFALSSSYSHTYTNMPAINTANPNPGYYPGLPFNTAYPQSRLGFWAGVTGAVAAAVPRPGRRKAPTPGSKEHAERAQPKFLANGHAMLLCKVAIGKPGVAGPHTRKPPPGCQSTSQGSTQYTVYDNDQAYPAYIVHYVMQ